MTQKAKDGGADELMKTNPRVSDDRPEDVEGHRQPTTTGGKDGFSGPKKPLYTGEDDTDVEGHATNKAKDAGQDGFSGPKKPLYTGEDDDVEGHRQPLPK